MLDKLASGASNASGTEATAASGAPSAATPKYLRIVVDQAGRKQVNMRLPLSILGSGAGLLGIMPQGAIDRIADCGINVESFSTLDLKDPGQAARDLNVDVEKGDKKIRIYCE